jgi:hypothetical protein
MISCLFLLRVRHVSENFVEKIKKTFMLNNFFPNSCLLWDNVDKYNRTRQAIEDNKIKRMRFLCWIIKTTNTLSEYVMLIAFPWQYCLLESTSILRYTYIVCSVCVTIVWMLRDNMRFNGTLAFYLLSCLARLAAIRLRGQMPKRSLFTVMFVAW